MRTLDECCLQAINICIFAKDCRAHFDRMYAKSYIPETESCAFWISVARQALNIFIFAKDCRAQFDKMYAKSHIAIYRVVRSVAAAAQVGESLAAPVAGPSYGLVQIQYGWPAL